MNQIKGMELSFSYTPIIINANSIEVSRTAITHGIPMYVNTDTSGMVIINVLSVTYHR